MYNYTFITNVEMRTTEPKPFNFQNTHHPPRMEFMDTSTPTPVDPILLAKKNMSR